MRDRLSAIELRGVANAALTVTFVLVVVAVAIHSVPAVVGAEASYIVLSGSMEPAISPGDIVVVYETDPATIEAGDVITFTRGTNPIPVTHRVIAVDDTGGTPLFETAGDNNEGPDPAPVSADRVVGVVPGLDLPVLGTVLFAIPFIGYVVAFGSTPIGLGVFVVVPIVLLFALEGWGALRKRRVRQTHSAADAPPVTEAQSTAETQPDAETRVTANVESVTQNSDVDDVRANAEADSAVEDAATSDAAMSVSTPDLRYTSVVLAVFTGYSALTAVLLEEVWAVSVAVALGGLTLMTVGVQRGWFTEATDAAGQPDPEADSLPDLEADSQPESKAESLPDPEAPAVEPPTVVRMEADEPVRKTENY